MTSPQPVKPALHHFRKQTKFIVFVLLVCLFLCSCAGPLPNDAPNLGMDIDLAQLNTTIKVEVAKSINTYLIGEPLSLEIANESDQVLNFYPDEIQIFRIENNAWVKVANTLKTIIVDDFMNIPNGVSSTKFLILKPKGTWPGDMRLMAINPGINPGKTVNLRIFFFAHEQETGNITPKTYGAFVDVTLIP